MRALRAPHAGCRDPGRLRVLLATRYPTVSTNRRGHGPRGDGARRARWVLLPWPWTRKAMRSRAHTPAQGCTNPNRRWHHANLGELHAQYLGVSFREGHGVFLQCRSPCGPLCFVYSVFSFIRSRSFLSLTPKDQRSKLNLHGAACAKVAQWHSGFAANLDRGHYGLHCSA